MCIPKKIKLICKFGSAPVGIKDKVHFVVVAPVEKKRYFLTCMGMQ